MVYYVAMLLKQAYDLTRSFKNKVEKLDNLIDFAKAKIEKSSSHLALVAEGVGQLAKFLINRKLDKKEKTKKKS
jgi:hypothetical protein